MANSRVANHELGIGAHFPGNEITALTKAGVDIRASRSDAWSTT
jgi:hypothetical protein